MIPPTTMLPKPADSIYPGVAAGGIWSRGNGPPMKPISPIDGEPTFTVGTADEDDIRRAIDSAERAFLNWRCVPAPRRGELIRRVGNLARAHQNELAELVCIESGKILREASGEIQEWIDICDFAVGLSRQLGGAAIASERVDHQLLELWQPLGPIGIISPFNFPAAIWAWNAMIALVCGNSVVWKPSEQTPLTALACHGLVCRAAAEMDVPEGISNLVIGGRETAACLAADSRISLVSASGSVAMGRNISQLVSARLGKCLLELGGNNAMIVTPSANLDLAVEAIVFAATGTCGQRCTSLRRLIVHPSLMDAVLQRLATAYSNLRIGDPRGPSTHIGPIIKDYAFLAMQTTIAAALQQGGRLIRGSGRVATEFPKGVYPEPAIIVVPANAPILKEESFSPILFVIEYENIEEAVAINNNVSQGLSSSIFSSSLEEAGRFLAPDGSDCGMIGVNVGTSGAEIGGAFGGEKQTGGGRVCGSDSWKQYMRRCTVTMNFGDTLRLAQNIDFTSPKQS